MRQKLLDLGEYAAAGLYEEPQRGLFYRKALGIRRYYENCEPAAYGGGCLYPSGILPRSMAIIPHYHKGLTVDSSLMRNKDSELFQRICSEFDVYHSSVPQEHSVAGNMYTHSMPHYERILAEGLLGYAERVQKIEDRDLREGLLHLIEGIGCYTERCVAYLQSVSADEKLVSALKKVPMRPADNVYEALVAWNFIMYLDNCDNLGCLAKGLAPYYRGEDITPWLSELYDNLDANNGYSMALDSEYPTLTVQCLKAAHGKRRPMIELFVDENTPNEIWQAALETVKSGGGQPAFYNAEVLLGGLKKRFPTIRKEDLSRFCGGGCTEAMIAGRSNVGSLDAGINLLLIMEKTMKEKLIEAATFEDFYGAYLEDVRKVVEMIKCEINRSRKRRAEYSPLPMRTLLVDDCIECQTEYNAGGARYNWSIINFGGLINVIDSMLAIRELVFDRKLYTAEQLLSALQRDDDELLTLAIISAPSFGKDDEDVNRFSNRISHDLFSMTEDGELCFGEGFLAASIQFQSQVGAGRRVGATPDGRHSGTPLCDSLAAIFGKDSRGATALLNSVTSLDLQGALGVPVLNFNVTQKMDDNILRALILGYMKKGGIQMQITYASKEELMDAYEHPERHGNLIVRVGGYSEYFCRLTPELQKMVVERTVRDGLL